MRRNNRARERSALTEQVEDWATFAEGEWLWECWMYWISKRWDDREHRELDPDCLCHDWARWQIRDTSKAYRAWCKRTGQAIHDVTPFWDELFDDVDDTADI